jgi:hypothetical protein
MGVGGGFPFTFVVSRSPFRGSLTDHIIGGAKNKRDSFLAATGFQPDN